MEEFAAVSATVSLPTGKAKQLVARALQNPSMPPIMLWGGPGIGKSSIIRQIAEEYGWAYKDVRLLQLEPIDLRGLPVQDLEKKKTVWLPPTFLPDTYHDGPEGIIIYDELTSAPPAVQAACYQLLLDRAIGEYNIPAGWRQVAAGNRLTDRGLVYRMLAPLANRLIHLEVYADLEDWKNWAIPNALDSRVIGFLSFRPELLYKFPQGATEIRGFPSPRTWEFVSTIIQNFPHPEEAFPLLVGCVGEGAASEFVAFCRNAENLPDPEKILSGSETCVPSSPDLRYAILSALVSCLIKDSARSRLENMFNYLTHFPVEFQTLAVTDLIRAGLRSQMLALPGFRDWVSKNSQVLLDE